MPMLFSSTTSYALRVLTVLPADGEFLRAKELSEQLGIPKPYLAKILQTLVQAGILESLKGPRGGFRLARPSKAISVEEVVCALEGPDGMEGCLLQLPECGGDAPCPLHDIWSKEKKRIERSLTTISIRDLQRRCATPKPRAAKGRVSS